MKIKVTYKDEGGEDEEVFDTLEQMNAWIRYMESRVERDYYNKFEIIDKVIL